MNRLSQVNEEELNKAASSISDSLFDRNPSDLFDDHHHHHHHVSEAHSLEDDSNYQIAIDLRDYLTKRKVVKPDTILNTLVDKELLFLKNNSNVVNRVEKSREIESQLEGTRERKSAEHARSQLKNVTAKINQNRNPCVKNFLKDVKSDEENKLTTEVTARSNEELTLDKLQESLKKEFSSFLTTTVGDSLETVKNVRKPSATKATDMKPTSSRATTTREGQIFITQHEDDFGVDQELADILGKNSTTRNLSSRRKQADSKLGAKSRVDSEVTKKEKPVSESQLQVALVEAEGENANNEGQKSIIRLKKMIDAIKKVDLPKFQTELHQICQYGADPQLFKFYPRVRIILFD